MFRGFVVRVDRFSAVALAGLALASPVAAQEDDWDLIRNDTTGVVTASVVFSDGFGIATRCTNGVFEVLMAGLPQAEGNDDTRLLEVGLGEDETYTQSWTNGSNRTVAFSQYPARFARVLRRGGVLRVTAQGAAEASAGTITVELPTSPAAVNETMTACDRPLEDNRLANVGWVVPTDGIPHPLTWRVQPAPEYPRDALRAGLVSGFAVVNCLAMPNGRLDDCEVESEFPVGYGFGEASIDGTRAARVRVEGQREVPPSIVIFRLQYLMEL